MDRRVRLRFDLTAPVKYSWTDLTGRHHGTGCTRDVSERGIFIVTDTLPPMGATVHFEVSFPFRDESQIQMRAQGRVVRVDSESGTATERGFATLTNLLALDNQPMPMPEENVSDSKVGS